MTDATIRAATAYGPQFSEVSLSTDAELFLTGDIQTTDGRIVLPSVEADRWAIELQADGFGVEDYR